MTDDLTDLLSRATRDVRAPADLLGRAAAKRRRHVATRVAGGALALLVVAGVALATDLVGGDEVDDVVIEPAPTDGGVATTGEEGTDGEGGTADDDVDPADPSQPGAADPTDPAATSGPGTAPGDDLVPVDAVLVAGDDGVHVLVDGGAAVQLEDAPARRAVDDGAGGLLVEAATSGPDAPSPAIRWRPVDGDELVEVVPEGLSDRVELHDGGLVDGRAAVVFEVGEDGGVDPEAYRASIQYRLLPDGERQRVVLRNSFESGYVAAALGGDVVAIQTFSEASTGFDVRDLGGEPVDVAANPLGEDGCFDSIECPSGFATSADGERFAWLVRSLDGATTTTTLVVVERDAMPVTQVVLPAGLEGEGRAADGVDLGETVAVVNRTRFGEGGAEPLAALRVDLRTGAVTEVARAGRVSVGTAAAG